MKKFRILVGVISIISLLVATEPFAQSWKGWRGSGGWGRGTQYQRVYDPATVETISRIVESVDETTPMRGMHYGIHLLVKTDKETISVHLGPGWYIERLDTKIEKGDKVQVKGSRVTIGGKSAIIASEVKKGDAVLKLRDDNGIPVWSGWRRRLQVYQRRKTGMAACLGHYCRHAARGVHRSHFQDKVSARPQTLQILCRVCTTLYRSQAAL